jgi:hypothetical protein
MDPATPKDPIDPAHNAIDISKILLPKKEVSSDSAERVNAGALLEQEQQAAAPTPQAAPTIPAPAAEQPYIRQLETYQGDIESVVEKKKVSVVSIAAAEAERRAKEIKVSPITAEASSTAKFLIVGLGILLLACAVGVLSFVYLRPASTTPVATTGAAPFIYVDSAEAVTLEQGDTPQEAMQTLEAAKESVHLSLGLIEELAPVEASSTGGTPILLSASDFISTLTPYAPDELLRTLSPTFLLGVHSYDENEAFLILQTDSYDTAYAGMLAWESTMMQDLSPLFVRHPSIPLQTTSASSTATSTAPTTFVDQVVDNHDARVLLDAQGNILLLWTFLDKQTLVIANNSATLGEIISRLTVPAVQALPQ